MENDIRRLTFLCLVLETKCQEGNIMEHQGLKKKNQCNISHDATRTFCTAFLDATVGNPVKLGAAL